MTRQSLSISPEMEQYLKTQIDADEKVLWASTSNFQGRMGRLRILPVMSLVMMVFCSVFSWSNPDRWILVLLSIVIWAAIPAVAIWSQSRHVRGTLYAVTNRRALIMTVGNPKKSESYPPEAIRFLRPEPKGGRLGDLYFTAFEDDDLRWEHGFLAIEDVNGVARLIREKLLDKST
jgi:hypothetical protein